jgi:hypothetical protein
MAEQTVEPWLRGTRVEVDAVRRGVIHALELASEDVVRWCGGLTNEETDARPMGLPSVGFQLRHIAGSLDRLLTYAEGQQLSELQMKALRSEIDAGCGNESSFVEFKEGIEAAVDRVLASEPDAGASPKPATRT